MLNIFDLEQQTEISQHNSYIISYPHIISYFQSIEKITESDIVRGAHMVYGWMPTVLDLYLDIPNKSLDELAIILNKAKIGGNITNSEISDIAAVVNNSVVGTSKLLHFIAPKYFAIWDSKIYRFIHEEKPYHYRVNNIQLYQDYLNKLNGIMKNDGFSTFHKNVIKKIGYEITPMRAMEIIMFLNTK